MTLPQRNTTLTLVVHSRALTLERPGITIKELLSRCYQKVFYNLCVSADVVIARQLRAPAALQLANPDSYTSHHTAAELWGLRVPTPALGSRHAPC